MLRRLTRRRKPTPAAPQPAAQPVVHHDHQPTYRGYLPADGQLVQAVCGCTGRVSRASARNGGHVSLLIQVSCRSGHPIPGTTGLEQVAAGGIAHFFADRIQPEQPTLDIEITQERTAA